MNGPQSHWLDDGRRLHLNHGPIDLIVQAFGEAGWRFALSGFAGPTFVEPFVGALAMHIETSSFSEAGGASALAGAAQGYDYGATTLGFRTQAALFGNSPLSARTMLGWQHVFGEVTPGSILAFESAPSIPFAITDGLQPLAGSPYGCCILALSGHQPHVPQGWTGGDRLAIHGTDAPATIGAAASSGCLRAADGDVRRLMRRVGLGSVVEISR